jgi:DNA-nicking Smr family endonuclease
LRQTTRRALESQMPGAVLAFASSSARHGGAGALTILLRRTREVS